MTEPTRVVARPPIGSENNLPTRSRTDIEREILRTFDEEWKRPISLPSAVALVLTLALGGYLVALAHTPADPLTIAGGLR